MSIYFLGLEMNPEEFAKLIIRYHQNLVLPKSVNILTICFFYPRDSTVRIIM